MAKAILFQCLMLHGRRCGNGIHLLAGQAGRLGSRQSASLPSIDGIAWVKWVVGWEDVLK